MDILDIRSDPERMTAPCHVLESMHVHVQMESYSTCCRSAVEPPTAYCRVSKSVSVRNQDLGATSPVSISHDEYYAYSIVIN